MSDLKQKKYELFRAIRRQEEDAAIELLKDPEVDPNWRHSYQGWTPLMHASFEKLPRLFRALLVHPNIDLSVRDDDGKDIYYWAGFSRPGEPDFRAMLNSRNPEKQSVIASTLKTILSVVGNAASELQPTRQPFFLLPTRPYVLLQDWHGMSKGEEVILAGSRHEYYDKLMYHEYIQFQARDRLIEIKDQSLPSLQESRSIFGDKLPDLPDANEQTRALLTELLDRSLETRIHTIAQLNSSTPEIQRLIPWIYFLAVVDSNRPQYMDKLVQLQPVSREVLENLEEDSFGYEREEEKVLCRLGCEKLIPRLTQMLSSSDIYEVQRALRRLGETGNVSVLPHIKPLVQHPHINVRYLAKKVYARLQN